MRVVICDRCGKDCDYNYIHFKAESITYFPDFDLCEDCKERLKQWIGEKWPISRKSREAYNYED
jgi:hypothetical protein